MAKRLSVKKSQPLSPEEEKLHELDCKINQLKVDLTDERVSKKYWMHQANAARREKEFVLGFTSSKPVPIKIKPRERKKTSETCPVLLCSDWHCEETILPSEVNGLNEFNIEIADKRIRALFEKTRMLMNIEQMETSISSMVLWLGGDFISGYIHDDLMEINSMSPSQALLWVTRRIMGGIDSLLDFGLTKLYIPCSPGNHGRTTQKKKITTSYRNSFEWLMYHFLALQYQSDDRVQFIISDSYHTLFDVYGRRLRLHHGDSIRYGGGIGGITIPVNKAVAGWDRADKSWMDCFGHFHQYHDTGKWICNPCLCGYNAYALSIKAPHEPPAQNLFFIEKDLGNTGTRRIYL